ncbi:proline-rich protein 36-like [Hyaena hyaena]|uniref:proline-rich protein 36-like n=1 Tax=Hyaena hyaena TaxID=95912 RepID=UPI0019207F64|nr:proline-rich protein 36-like [Hyaena hyaena]
MGDPEAQEAMGRARQGERPCAGLPPDSKFFQAHKLNPDAGKKAGAAAGTRGLEAPLLRRLPEVKGQLASGPARGWGSSAAPSALTTRKVPCALTLEATAPGDKARLRRSLAPGRLLARSLAPGRLLARRVPELRGRRLGRGGGGVWRVPLFPPLLCAPLLFLCSCPLRFQLLFLVSASHPNLPFFRLCSGSPVPFPLPCPCPGPSVCLSHATSVPPAPPGGLLVPPFCLHSQSAFHCSFFSLTFHSSSCSVPSPSCRRCVSTPSPPCLPRFPGQPPPRFPSQLLGLSASRLCVSPQVPLPPAAAGRPLAGRPHELVTLVSRLRTDSPVIRVSHFTTVRSRPGPTSPPLSGGKGAISRGGGAHSRPSLFSGSGWWFLRSSSSPGSFRTPSARDCRCSPLSLPRLPRSQSARGVAAGRRGGRGVSAAACDLALQSPLPGQAPTPPDPGRGPRLLGVRVPALPVCARTRLSVSVRARARTCARARACACLVRARLPVRVRALAPPAFPTPSPSSLPLLLPLPSRSPHPSLFSVRLVLSPPGLFLPLPSLSPLFPAPAPRAPGTPRPSLTPLLSRPLSSSARFCPARPLSTLQSPLFSVSLVPVRAPPPSACSPPLPCPALAFSSRPSPSPPSFCLSFPPLPVPLTPSVFPAPVRSSAPHPPLLSRTVSCLRPSSPISDSLPSSPYSSFPQPSPSPPPSPFLSLLPSLSGPPPSLSSLSPFLVPPHSICPPPRAFSSLLSYLLPSPARFHPFSPHPFSLSLSLSLFLPDFFPRTRLLSSEPCLLGGPSTPRPCRRSELLSRLPP